MTRKWKITYEDGDFAILDEPTILDLFDCSVTGMKAMNVVPLKMVADYAVPRTWLEGGYSVLPYEVGKQPKDARKIEGSEREVEE